MTTSQSFEHQEVLGLRFGYSPIGKPSMFAHVYFVDGLLIDTGQSNAQNKVLSTTKNLGIEQIFLTHHHEDHTGNVAALQEQHNCEVFASELCSQMMQNPPKISFAQKITWGNRPPKTDIVPISETIQTNKFTFQIIPIPGHAPDMVALYEPNEKWLFSADLYIGSYIDYFLDDESMATQIASTKKILELDFQQLFCGHKPRLENGKEHLSKKLHFLETFFGQVAELYEKGYTDKEIFKKLKLKENRFVKTLSGSKLSKLNMVRSVIRDLDNE